MAVRVHCSPCGAEIHQPNAELLGPPDLSNRARKHAICRTCFARLMAYWPALREKGQADRAGLAGAPLAVPAPAPPAASRPGGTRPGRRNSLAR